MPRRLIIGLLVLLILGILGGTVVLVVQRLQSTAEDSTTTTPSPRSLTPADVGNQQVANPTADDDGDGLTNADEATWGTLPANADTDGDGFRDGDEVTANHNPTVAGPNDALPAGFVPGQNIEPVASAPVEVNQYFEDGLDVTGGPRNLTEQYAVEVSDEQQSPESMTAYAAQQPIITNLPRAKLASIQTQSSDSSFAVSGYLTTAGDTAVLDNKQLLGFALYDLYEKRDGAAMRGMALQVRNYQENLIALQVPPSALSTQQLLLGYTELLAATMDQVANLNDDPIRTMVAMRQLNTIDRQYYPLIQQELTRLRTQAGSS